MAIGHVFGLFTNAKSQWAAIRAADPGVGKTLVLHTMIFALMPAVAGFVGTTQTGWQVGGTGPVKLTTESALPIAVAYYFAMIAATFSVGWMIRWMSQTYGADPPLSRCFALASYTATPLFLVGLLQLYPILWLNLVIGLPALGHAVFLFYAGVPVMMEIPEERGFLFATAVMGFGLVALVAMLAVTVLLWGSGFAPEFTR